MNDHKKYHRTPINEFLLKMETGIAKALRGTKTHTIGHLAIFYAND